MWIDKLIRNCEFAKQMLALYLLTILRSFRGFRIPSVIVIRRSLFIKVVCVRVKKQGDDGVT